MTNTHLIEEKSLLAAMIERAILDAIGDAGIDMEDRRSAREWLITIPQDEFKPEVLSFAWCCQHLDLDPSIIRKTITLELLLQKEANCIYINHDFR